MSADSRAAEGPGPAISVIIPTRNRPDDIRRCLESLTRVRYPQWDILVVDQSDDTRTQVVIESFAHTLPSVTHLRMPGRGSARARNTGMQAAQADIVALLDDDCTVEPNWLVSVADAFARNPQAALVCGAVKAAPYDMETYFLPTYEVAVEHALRRRLDVLRHGVMSACMYLRRSLIEEVGLFDMHLGTGAHFHSSEDWEYCYRVLAAGKVVVATPAIVVCHYGVRPYANGSASRLIRDAAYSFGAVDMKWLRCGHMSALGLVGGHVWMFIRTLNLGNLLAGRGRTGLAWPLMYMRGLVDSFQLGVDRGHCLYQQPPGGDGDHALSRW